MTIPTATPPDENMVSFQLLDAAGRVLAGEDADRPYYAASTIKLHVALAVLAAADRGELDLTAEVSATRTFTGAGDEPFTLTGDHLDPSHPTDGSPIEVGELLRRMIDRSSNEATNHLIELVGLPAVAATIADLGLRATRVERLIGDAAALASGATNETSAADLAYTMLSVVRRDDPTLTAALRDQQIPIIGTALPAGSVWGSKSGWVEGFRHDVAFVGEADQLRALAVMTAGLEEAAADRRITALARELLS
ncbi:serine hydrolase [Parenemella sanctibonifatiensis]|uniref:Serine hydrolase n=1 Tax=Parenemella sanctibonifatiensis TaxID=2016505 RepID=A0A255EG50_9ACTN|nr:serine hydrolase [Parenemella sanctibonifatiensis]OYN90509.1 serine hydrolase [Parenemella sanctibonifatiensis]